MPLRNVQKTNKSTLLMVPLNSAVAESFLYRIAAVNHVYCGTREYLQRTYLLNYYYFFLDYLHNATTWNAH